MKSNNRGFTLLEVMVTIGILGLVLGYFTSFYRNEINLYFSKDNDIELKQDARIAMDRIVSKIRMTENLSYEAGTDGTGVICQGAQVIVNTTRNEPVGDINYYYDSGKEVGEIRDASGNRIAGNVKDFRLDRIDIPGTDGLVEITISCGNNKSESVKTYSTAVRMH